MEILTRKLSLHFCSKILFPKSIPNSQINFYSRVSASFFSTTAKTQSHSSSSSSNRVLASLFATATQTQSHSSSSSDSVLCNRIKSIRDPLASVIPVLEQWVNDGNSITKSQFIYLIGLLKNFRRFNHALEISNWMTDHQYSALSPTDAAVRLNLIHRVYGPAQAESYFKKLPDKLKTYHVYGALLNSYVQENFVEKAEAIMHEMREKGMAKSTFPYNILINLYTKTGDFQKIEGLIQEMKRSGIRGDKFTMVNLMANYIAASNISGMERILNLIEENPQLCLGWSVYALAACGYLKVGSIKTALTMLRKIEGMIPHNGTPTAFNFLLRRYAETGSKDEVYRVWNAYKPLLKLTDMSYCSMISSLSKLDDIEGAEKIFEEWESQCTIYDFRVLKSLLIAYCNRGLFEKAEAAIEKAVEGRTPYAGTYDVMATGYLQHNQLSKAVEMLKKATLVSRKGWRPNPNTLTACLNYLETRGDVEGIVEIMKFLKYSEPSKRDMCDRLIRTCTAAGKSATEIIDKMKMHNFPDDEEMYKILEDKFSL